MSIAAGVSIGKIAPGGPVSLAITKVDQAEHTQFFHSVIPDDASDLSSALASTLRELRAQLSSPPKNAVFTLPLGVSNDEEALVQAAAREAGLTVLRVVPEIKHMKYDLNKGDVSPWNDLVILITPFYAASQLLVAEIEENVATSDKIDEVLIADVESVSTTAGILHHLITPITNKLKTMPSIAGSALQRIVLITPSPTLVPSDVVKQLQLDFQVPVIISDHPAEFAAALALKLLDLNENHSYFITDIAELRIGVARADGFVAPIFDQNRTIPSSQSALLTTSSIAQTSATITVVVGESPYVPKNATIAEFKLAGITPGEPRIKITAEIDANRQLMVLAQEILKGGEVGASASVTLKSPMGDLDYPTILSYVQDKSNSELYEAWKATWVADVEAANASWKGKSVVGALPE